MKKTISILLAGVIASQMMGVIPVIAQEEALTPVNAAYTVEASPDVDYNMNIGWKFFIPEYTELMNPTEGQTGVSYWNYEDSLNYVKEEFGGGEKNFYDVDFDDSSWETVSVPHTYNDEDIFDSHGSGSGESCTKAISFYRKHFTLDEKHEGQKIFLEFEGIRQTAYVWVNGEPVGIYQLGVDPFGFDITEYVNIGGDNVVAVANDSSGGGNAAWGFHHETKPDSEWGASDGVKVQWNSAAFNPVLSGLTRNVILHTKNRVYQTLPLYSNLKTTGTYVYGSDYDIPSKSVTINVESELRNESDTDEDVKIKVDVVDKDGNLQWSFETAQTETVTVAADKDTAFTSIVADDAYQWEDAYRALTEDEQDAVTDDDPTVAEPPAPTDTSTVEVKVVKASARVTGMRFWSPDDPYLYNVYVTLTDDEGNVLDVNEISTGFRKTEIKGGTEDAGIFINDKNYYLTGYAQRATNEWAAIGASVDWLDDFDMEFLRENNANFVRWMHIAAQPADIRSCDKYGIAVAQPAGDGEEDTKGRQWDHRVEVMRDTIIYFRNNPSIILWEAGNNTICSAHMKEMTDLRKLLDPNGGRAMGCRGMGGATEDHKQGVEECEYVGTMYGRSLEDDNGFRSWAQETIEKRAIVETEYYRQEAPRRVWDNYSAPWYDYVHNPTKKQNDTYDLTSEEYVVGMIKEFNFYYSNRVNSNSSRPTYSGAAMLCWTDSMQHARQVNTENGRMSGPSDPVRIKKPSYGALQVMQGREPGVYLVGHWNYSQNISDYPEDIDPTNKTVYVVAANVKYVELFIDGVSQGKCVSPTDGFLYTFKGIDVTKTGGYIEAVGYNTKGEVLARHKIETAGEAAQIKLTPVTGPNGLIADGADVAFFDVEVTDAEGRVIPDMYTKLECSVTGDAELRGGYNSGCAPWDDTTQEYPNQLLNHNPEVTYAECGKNRIFVRAGFTGGDVTLNVTAPELGLSGSATITSVDFATENGLTTVKPQSVVNAEIEPRAEVEAPKQSAMLPLITWSKIIFGEGGNTYIYKEEDTRQYITVYVDGVEAEGLTAYMMANSVFGDLELFAQAIGAEVEQPTYGTDLNSAMIVIKRGDKTVRLKGSKIYDENGDELKTIQQISEWVDGKLYAELSVITEELGLAADSVTADMTEYNVWTGEIGDVDYAFTLDVTGLTAADYNADEYVELNKVVSIKSDPEYIASDSMKLTKSNGTKIKIVPKTDGEIIVTFSGSGTVIMPTYENRKGGETTLETDVGVAVTAGTVYYLQGASSSAAKITQIEFKESAE